MVTDLVMKYISWNNGARYERKRERAIFCGSGNEEMPWEEKGRMCQNSG